MVREAYAERLEPNVLAPRCLVVDDDAAVRRSIAKVIELLGLAPLVADDAAAGLALLEREGEVPLIISDINMPGMNGQAFLEEVLRRYPDTAVIILSGVSSVQTAVTCLDRGALDYIAKPAMIEEVRARVRKALEKRDLTLQKRFYQKNFELRVKVQATRIRELFLQGVQMLSGVREAETAIECLMAGALDDTTKPALLGEIRSRIQRALDRSYRASLPAESACEEIRACAGTHFDAEVVAAFPAEFPDPGLMTLAG